MAHGKAADQEVRDRPFGGLAEPFQRHIGVPSQGGGISDSSFKRYLVSSGGSFLTNLLLGTRMADMTSGFELFSRETMQAILKRGIRSRAHFFQTEIKVFCRNRRYLEVPITYRMASPRLSNKAIVEALRQLTSMFVQRMTGRL